MDKILSARVDEATVRQLALLSTELNMTKKAIIESAIKLYSQQKGMENKVNALEKTCGVWQREESPQEDILKARLIFGKSMKRHHQ